MEAPSRTQKVDLPPNGYHRCLSSCVYLPYLLEFSPTPAPTSRTPRSPLDPPTSASTHVLEDSLRGQDILRQAPPINADWAKIDALLEDLPPGIPMLPPEDAGNFEKYTHRPRYVYAPGEGWKNCARALEKYDAELCKGYREEIDTLLVFAGLFSAVVTAFTIESYKWLQADPTDAIVELLSHIARSVSPNNTAASSVSASAAPALPRSVSVRINVYWFLALAISLSAALVAILCKQWVREFERNPGLTPLNFVGIHQTKLEGFEHWRVGGIVSLLPLLLQLALAIFALGVLELLWQLHSVVSAIVCVPTLAAFIFYTATTVVPALQRPYHLSHSDTSSFWGKLPECPYKSPQAILVFPLYEFYLWIEESITSGALYLWYCLSLARYHLATKVHSYRNISRPFFRGRFGRPNLYVPTWRMVSWHYNFWLDYVVDRQPLSMYRSLRWMRVNLEDGDVTKWTWHCLWEQATVPNSESRDLDDKEQGFYHVACGDTGHHRIDLRALALSCLLDAHAPGPFAVEAYVQNLSTLDVTSAKQLTDKLHSGIFRHCLDAEETATILRVASEYSRVRFQEPIGDFLVSVASLAIRISDPTLRRFLLRHSLLLYHIWLGTQSMPHQPATVESTEAMVRVQIHWLLAEPEDYYDHPEYLHRRPGMHELAALVTVYADSHADPMAALAAKLDRDDDEIGPIFTALQEFARQGIDPGDAETRAAAANDSTLSLPASGSSSSIAARASAFSTAGEPQSRTERNSGRGAVSRTRGLGQVASDGPTVEGSGGHDAVPPDSPTLRAVVIHASRSQKSAQMPSEDDALARTRGDGGKTTAAEGAPFQGECAAPRAPAPSGEQHARRSSGYNEARSQTDGETDEETRGDAYDGGTHESPALPSRSVLVHAPSSVGSQPLPQHDRAALPDKERVAEATGDAGGQETSESRTDGRSERHGSQSQVLHAVVIHAPSGTDAQIVPEHDRAGAFGALGAEASRADGERANDTEGGSGAGGFGLEDGATRAVPRLSRAPLAHDGGNAGHYMEGDTSGDDGRTETSALNASRIKRVHENAPGDLGRSS